PHRSAVLAYTRSVTGAAGQRTYSAGVDHASLERWLYYPLHLVNDGLGSGTAALVVALAFLAAGARLVGGSTKVAAGVEPARPPSGGGALLATTALLSAVLVAVGQTAAESQYVMPHVPLILLGACLAVRSLPGRGVRRGAAVALGASIAVYAALAMRSFEHDAPGLRTGRIEWVSRYDFGLARSAREVGAAARPDAERWPLGDVVESVRARSEDGVVRIGVASHHHHPFVNGGNLRAEALRRGVPCTVTALAGLPKPTRAQVRDFLRDVDVMVLDRFRHQGFERGETRRLLDLLRDAGARVEEIAAFPVTARSDLRVLRLALDDDVEALVPPARALAPPTRPAEVRFEGGWTLRGVLRTDVEGAPAFVLYFDAAPGATAGLEAFVDGAHGGAVTAKARIPLEPGPTDGRLLRLDVDPLEGATEARLGLRVRGGGRRREDHARVESSDLPKVGSYQVLLTP
ncbi:MAG TPA: hypothetical protein VEI02_15670, partial [Planctomycetota bacterium]|nr:hypothetical protein [Planctomycetota bacterium]